MGRIGYTVVLLLASGCSQEDPWSAVDHEVRDERIVEGDYTAAVEIVVRAFFGGVPVARARCADDIPMVVDLSERNHLVGWLSCDLPYVGGQLVEIEGKVERAPYIDGDTDGDLDLDWEGGFTSPTTFFGEAYGEDDDDGLRVELTGTIDGWRDP